MKRQLCQLLEVLLLACALLPAISLAHSGTPGDPPMMLQGTILDAESGDPISGNKISQGHKAPG